MEYLHWDETTITDFSPENVSEMYEKGYVFTRKGKGVMQQTRSVRIDLNKFQLSSENRRILKKNEKLAFINEKLPLNEYDFKLGKLAKDFYEDKFGPGIMSAQKVKEMVTDSNKSNFNSLTTFSLRGVKRADVQIISTLTKFGYVISYENKNIFHYCYPFYDLNASKDTGLGMMTLTILYAKQKGLKYIYLGSLQRPSDTYKLQFEGLEWFDGTKWQTDLEAVKKILASAKIPE